MKDSWWNGDVFKVDLTDVEASVTLNPGAPMYDPTVSALVAVRFLFSRHNVEPVNVTLDLDAETFCDYFDKLTGQSVVAKDGSFSWGGFTFKLAK